MSTSYGPLLADGNQSEEGLEASADHLQIQSHARVSQTTGGTYQKDYGSLNQRLEEDKSRASMDIIVNPDQNSPLK